MTSKTALAKQAAAYRKARAALRKAVPPALRVEAKGTGWRVAQGLLFRELNGWFLQVSGSPWVMEPRVTASLHAKPMGLDPLFWDVTGLTDNHALPLSFRATGAFTCSPPTLAKAELVDCDDAVEIAKSIVSWARTAETEFDTTAAMTALMDKLAPDSDPFIGRYQATYACLLMLQNRFDEARTYCEETRRRGETGGFMNVDLAAATFFDAAVRWLDKPRDLSSPDILNG